MVGHRGLCQLGLEGMVSPFRPVRMSWEVQLEDLTLKLNDHSHHAK